MSSSSVCLPSTVKPASGSVFHYTSARGLLGIVEKGELWASAASSLNDVKEVKQGWRRVRATLANMPSGLGRDELVDLAERPMKKNHQVFVLSASTVGDDANQWRLYAENGSGYAVELDAGVDLMAFSTVEATPVAGLGGRRLLSQIITDSASVSRWLPVLYTKSAVSKALEELSDHVDVELTKLESTSGMPDDELVMARQELQSEAYDSLATIAHLVKTRGFKDEHEVRVVATFMLESDQIQYRATPRGVVGYARLTQATPGQRGVMRPTSGRPLARNLPLRTVRTGPLLPKGHEATIGTLLKRNGMPSVVTKRSHVPLR